MYWFRSTIWRAGPYFQVWYAPVMKASYWLPRLASAVVTLSKYTSSGKMS